MEIHCPSCARKLVVPDEAVTEDDSNTIRTITSVNCPQCGAISLDAWFRKTATFQGSQDDFESKQIAHFTLVRKLGRGGYGTVWLANDNALNRQVALKLPVDKGRETDNLLREAQTAASLRHPNILSIYEVGSDNGRAFIATEYIDGLTLRDLLSSGRPPTQRAVRLMAAVANALHYAHEHGVIHRDVKPANILLNREGVPYVADFGIAKRISADATITSEGQIVGTARYMSPEQASGRSRETDRRSDVYPLGVILFEMLTGDTPFRGNVRALMHQKLFEEAPSPRKLDPAVPKDLETICLKCLERDPDKRYQTAAEVADELTRFDAGEPIQARPISSLERFWRRCRRRPVVAALVASLFLSLTIGLVGVSTFWLQARRSAERLERSWYRSQMNLAASYLDQGDMAGMQRVLGHFGPETPRANLRGFEWYFFDQVMSPVREVANQGAPVIDVAVSHDGGLCAASAKEHTIRAWNSKGELIQQFSINPGQFLSLEFSPVSSELAAGSSDGMLRIYNPLTNDGPVREIKHGLGVALVRYSPNGKYILSAAEEKAIRIWNAADLSKVDEIPTGMSGTKDARFLADGQQFVVLGKDGTVKLGEIGSTDKPRYLLENPGAHSLALSDDGQILVTGDQSGLLRIWSMAEETLLHETRVLAAGIGDLEFIKQSHVLAMAIGNGDLRFFDVDTKQERNRLQTHTLSMGLLARASGGKWLAIGSGDGTVRLVQPSELLRHSVFWQSNAVRGAAFLPDSKTLLVATSDGSLSLLDTHSGQVNCFGSATDAVTTMAHSPGGKLIAVGGTGRTVELWNYDTEKRIVEIDVGASNVSSLAFSASGDRLAVGLRDGPVMLFAASDWAKPTVTIKAGKSHTTAVMFAANQRELIVAHQDGLVQFYNAASGATGNRSLRIKASPLTLCLCEQGKLLAIGTDVGEVHLWEVESGRMRHVIKGHSGRIATMNALTNGTTLVSAGQDRDLKLWDTIAGEPITILSGHIRRVFCVAVSPDGNTLASGGLEGDIRMWSARKRK